MSGLAARMEHPGQLSVRRGQSGVRFRRLSCARQEASCHTADDEEGFYKHIFAGIRPLLSVYYKMTS